MLIPAPKCTTGETKILALYCQMLALYLHFWDKNKDYGKIERFWPVGDNINKGGGGSTFQVEDGTLTGDLKG